MDTGLKIRQMTFQDWELVISWVLKYSGSPYTADETASFFATDPTGFFIGELNGEPIASVTAVKYNNYAHVGFYFVLPEFRKQGYGLKMFQYAMETVKDFPSAGINSVPAQVENYAKSGFKCHDKVLRFTRKAQGELSSDLTDLKKIPIDQLIEYDQPIFGGNSRKGYLESALQQESFHALGKLKEGKLSGYGVLRTSSTANRFGLVMADDKETAEQIISGLQSLVAGEDVFIDIFEGNEDARKIIKEQQDWKSVLTTDRMYYGSAPSFDVKRIYCPFVQIG